MDLQVAPVGGAGTYVRGFCQGLIEGAFSSPSLVVVLVSAMWAELNFATVAKLRSLGFLVDVIDTPEPGTWKARLTRGLSISRSARRNGCSVAFIPRDVAPQLRIPYVILARNQFAWHRYSSYPPFGGPFSVPLLRLTARRSARKAAGVLAVSRAFADSMPSTVKVTGVVHHGCAMEEVDRTMSICQAESLNVSMIANVMANKRIEVVVDGVAIASARGRSFNLRVFGRNSDPEYAKRIECQALARLGISVLQGPAFDAELVNVYRESHIVAIGGSFETFCFPLLEGMRSGCVVVAPRSVLAAEICGDVAVTYTEGDSESLADALEIAAREYAVRSRRGVERARDFTWARTVEKTLQYVRGCE